MDRNQDRGAIARNVQAVLGSFRNLTASFAESSTNQPGPTHLNKLLPSFENEITRFKMWAGNLAAHQSGPASLDHRLREAPHLQEQVVYLLSDISESLEDTIAVTLLHGESPKNGENVRDEVAPSEGSPEQISDDDFTDSDLDGDEDVSPEARLSTLCLDIGEAIDCLLRLSVAIANPVPHERFRKLGGGPSEDVSFYEEHDMRYVRDKFPKIDKGLSEVLGKFITRRRQFFKYREAHHAKLAAGLDQENQKDTSRTELVPKTVASSLPEHFKGMGVIDEDNRSDMAMSETSYATSAGFLIQEDGQIKPAPPLKVPPPPAEAEKGAFECPFCYRMISASTRGAWKRHVFGDLRPYTCLFSRCVDSNTDFDRRHRWQLHVSQFHWRTWSCPFKCGNMFPSAVDLEKHIRHQHLPNASDEQLSTVIARGEVSVSDDVSKECPLCGHVISGLKSYIKHVGRHLEQLALFALPSIEDDGLEDEVDSDEQNDVVSGLDAESTDNGSMDSSHALEQLETGETDGRSGIEGNYGTKGNNREQEDEHLQERIDVVLKDANVAAQLHNDGDFRGAREAYVKASGSMQQILEEVSYGERRRLLESLQRSYLDHIETLDRNISEAAIRREAYEAFCRKKEAWRKAQEEVKKEIEVAKLEAEKAARERLEAERKAEEERARNHAQAMKEAEEQTRLRFEAEMKAAEALRKAEANAHAKAGEEARKIYEAEKKAAEAHRRAAEDFLAKAESEAAGGQGGQGAGEPVRAEMREEEEREHAEELASVRLQKAMQAETEAKAVAAMKAQREDDHIMRTEQQLDASEKELPPIDANDDARPVAQDARPTHTRFARRHLSIETLRTFGVDFTLDADPEYLLVKRWVPAGEQELMWKHTGRIREERRHLIFGDPPDSALREPELEEGVAKETSREHRLLEADWGEQELEHVKHEQDVVGMRQTRDEEEGRKKHLFNPKSPQEVDEAFEDQLSEQENTAAKKKLERIAGEEKPTDQKDKEAAKTFQRYRLQERSHIAEVESDREVRGKEHQQRLSPTPSLPSTSRGLRPEILGVQHERFTEGNARKFDRLERADASNFIDAADDLIIKVRKPDDEDEGQHEHDAQGGAGSGRLRGKPLPPIIVEDPHDILAMKRARGTVAALKPQKLEDLEEKISKLETEREHWKRIAFGDDRMMVPEAVTGIKERASNSPLSDQPTWISQLPPGDGNVSFVAPSASIVNAGSSDAGIGGYSLADGPSNDSLNQKAPGTGSFTISDPPLRSSQSSNIQETSTKAFEDSNDSDASVPGASFNMFVCEVCNHGFRLQEHLRLHSLSHTGKPLECSECGEKFVHSENLARHVREHDSSAMTTKLTNENEPQAHSASATAQPASDDYSVYSPPQIAPQLRPLAREDRIRIVERGRERSLSPPPPLPPPRFIPGPTIEREIVTHYRHIDHRIPMTIPKARPRQDQEDAARHNKQQEWDPMALDKEYQERLEADLRRSGIDEVEINAILNKEKANSHREVGKGKAPEVLARTDMGGEASEMMADPGIGVLSSDSVADGGLSSPHPSGNASVVSEPAEGTEILIGSGDTDIKVKVL